jgi:hypothetical protein
VVAFALWALVVLLPDVLLGRFQVARLGAVRTAFLPLAFAASLAAWALSLTGLSRLRARRGGAFLFLPVALVLSIVVPFFVLAVERYRRIMGVDLPPSAAAFMLENPRYAFALMREAFGPAVGGALLVAGLLLFALLAWATRPPLTMPWRGARLRVAAGLTIFVLTLTLVFPRLPLPPDLHGVRALALGIFLPATSDSKLPDPTARPVLPNAPRQPGARATNVILLLHESVPSSAWAPWSPSGAPALEGFFARHADRVVVYSAASSAATCTDVSLPSLFTGLDADAPRDAYRRAPILWQEAKASGLVTELYSAQDFNWAGFRGFFLGANAPDAVKTASDYPEDRRTIDRGVDDRLAVDDAVRVIEAHAESRSSPFFMVIHFNATHAPCWATDEDATAEARASGPSRFGSDRASDEARCRRSAAFVADQNLRVLLALERNGLLDDTLVVGTSDHGETFRDDRPTRIENYFDEVLRVPLYLLMPDAVVKDSPDLAKAARENRGRQVSNVDVFPTVLEVLGRTPAGASSSRPPLAGSSLLHPVDEERVLVASNTNDIRSWSRDGFAVIHGRYKWLVDEYEGAKLFDRDVDPGETRDLSREAPATEVEVLRREAKARPHMARLLDVVAPRLVDSMRP